MNDSELLDEFIRVERTASGFDILVRQIHWQGPHSPSSTWTVDQNLPTSATETEVHAATERVLEDQRYFLSCNECQQRKPLGWMHIGGICQGCATRNHGVVY